MDFFTALYEFMDHEELELRRIACRCLCDIIQKLKKGAYAFNLITKAATNQAKQNNKAPFDELILSVSKFGEDPELCLASLEFINLILFRCPTKKKRSQFLARLENLGLHDELYKVGFECNLENPIDVKIINQL